MAVVESVATRPRQHPDMDRGIVVLARVTSAGAGARGHKTHRLAHGWAVWRSGRNRVQQCADGYPAFVIS